MNANLAARLAERAVLHPERPAIVEYRRGRARRVSFGELSTRVAALAAGLSERGVGPGDRVLILVPMSIDLYLTLLAVVHLGATAVFVDAWADRRRLDAAIAAARPRAWIGTPKAQLLRLASHALRAIPISILAGAMLSRLERRPGAAPAEVAADAPALITFTTGSTGRPKAAARSHAFLWAQHEVLADHLGIGPGDVDMPTLPVFVLNNLASGTTSVLPHFDPKRPAEIDPAAVLAQMEAEGVTTTSGSPAFYQRLCGWCREQRRRLPVRALFTGGAPVLPRLAELLAEPQLILGTAHIVYGSTEAEPIAGITALEMVRAMNRDGGARAEGLCVGAPVPQVTLRLIHPFDAPVALGERGWSEWEVAQGETGEVIVTGAHVLSGYLDDPEADRANKIRDGARVWHRTGDGARLDPQGRLWLMGRVAHRVRRAGQTSWALPAELRALEVAGITHAALIGEPDAALGERAVLCVESPGGRLSKTQRESLGAHLAPIPVDEIVALDHIPRDPRHASKTDAEALRAMLHRR